MTKTQDNNKTDTTHQTNHASDDAHTSQQTDHTTETGNHATPEGGTTHSNAKDNNNDIHDVQKKLSQQTKEIEKLEAIAKQTQFNYISLKRDFDAFQTRVAAQADDAKINALIEVTKKLLPAIDKLKQVVTHIPDDLQENSWVAGVRMINDLLDAELEQLHIVYESHLGKQPDPQKHQPIGTQVVAKKNQIGTIVAEVSQCVMYHHNNISKVIREGQVTIGVDSDTA